MNPQPNNIDPNDPPVDEAGSPAPSRMPAWSGVLTPVHEAQLTDRLRSHLAKKATRDQSRLMGELAATVSETNAFVQTRRSKQSGQSFMKFRDLVRSIQQRTTGKKITDLKNVLKTFCVSDAEPAASRTLIVEIEQCLDGLCRRVRQNLLPQLVKEANQIYKLGIQGNEASVLNFQSFFDNLNDARLTLLGGDKEAIRIAFFATDRDSWRFKVVQWVNDAQQAFADEVERRRN